MRAFIAIQVPEKICVRIQELMQMLRAAAPPARWARPEGLHLTLKFLGEISAEQAEQVKARLLTLSDAAPPSIRIAGAGFFPTHNSPRVVWLGIEAGPELRELACRVEETLAPLGFAKEDRPFAPHLTLARTNGGGARWRELLRRHEPIEMGSFVARDFFLYESRSAPGGSIYTKVARFPLASGSAQSGEPG